MKFPLITVSNALASAGESVAYVVEFSKRDVAELYELREALEVYAVGKAAEHELRPPDRLNEYDEWERENALGRVLPDLVGIGEP